MVEQVTGLVEWSIVVFVSTAEAIKNGSSVSGMAHVRPTKAQMSTVTARETAALLPYTTRGILSHHNKAIGVSEATWEAICVSVRKELADHDAQIASVALDAKLAADKEEKRLLALSDIELGREARDINLFRTSTVTALKRPALVARLPAANLADKNAIAAQLEAREAEEARIRKHREQAAEFEAVQVAELARVKLAAQAELTAWALTQDGALHRAAKEGYDVAGLVAHEVVRQISWRLQARTVRVFDDAALVSGTAAWNRANWNQRRSPNEAAFEVYDFCAEAIVAVLKPSCVTVRLEKIAHVEVSREDGSDPIFTAVPIWIESPAFGSRVLLAMVPR